MMLSVALRALNRPQSVVRNSRKAFAGLNSETYFQFLFQDKLFLSTDASMHKKALKVLLNHTNSAMPSASSGEKSFAIADTVERQETASGGLDKTVSNSEATMDVKGRSTTSPKNEDTVKAKHQANDVAINGPAKLDTEQTEAVKTRPFAPPEHLLHEFAPKIVVVGVGGAGGNALNNMIAKELSGVDFLALNTDAQHLSSTLTDNRLQLGVQLTQGLGCGANPDAGRLAAEESREQIEDRLSDAHLVFITAGMGGGTGTGGE